jgi:predicted secreted protein
MTTTNLRIAFLLFGVSAACIAARAETPPPSGVVALTASATAEVPKDMMTITFSVTRDGPDPNAVQAALKQALDAALAEARRAAKPGQVDVQTGAFSLYPRTSGKGLITNWQGTAELAVEGRDMPAIAQLAGRISTMTVGRVGYGLSREARQKSEADVTGEAVARYRAKAADAAKAFGYGGYVIREVNVSSNEPPPFIPLARAQMMSKDSSAEGAALPVEAGRAAVTVTVSGTVQMR